MEWLTDHTMITIQTLTSLMSAPCIILFPDCVCAIGI